MLFSTPTQYAALALCLVAGWLLGLASHPGGRKWKARYAAERDAHALTRRDADARVVEHRSTIEDRDVATRKRIAELERENDRLAQAAPVTASTIGSHDRVATQTSTMPVGTRTVIAPSGRTTVGNGRGWFDFR